MHFRFSFQNIAYLVVDSSIVKISILCTLYKNMHSIGIFIDLRVKRADEIRQCGSGSD